MIHSIASLPHLIAVWTEVTASGSVVALYLMDAAKAFTGAL